MSRISAASFEASLFLETFSFVKLEFAFPPARRRRSPEALSLSLLAIVETMDQRITRCLSWTLNSVVAALPRKGHRPTDRRGHVEKSRRDAIVTRLYPNEDQTINRDTRRSFSSVSPFEILCPNLPDFLRIEYSSKDEKEQRILSRSGVVKPTLSILRANFFLKRASKFCK